MLFSGYVKDYSDHPVSKAQIKVVEKNLTISADENGKYGFPLSPGKYTLKIDAKGYYGNVKIVDVNAINEFPKVVVVTLKKDLSVLGMPRLVFVILTGELDSINRKAPITLVLFDSRNSLHRCFGFRYLLLHGL